MQTDLVDVDGRWLEVRPDAKDDEWPVLREVGDDEQREDARRARVARSVLRLCAVVRLELLHGREKSKVLAIHCEDRGFTFWSGNPQDSSV